MARAASQVNAPGQPVVILSCAEAAGMLRISIRTLENMRLEKRGPPFLRFGHGKVSKVVYRLSDIEQWLDRCADR